MTKLILFIIVCLCFSACSFNSDYTIENGNVYFRKPNFKDFQYKKYSRKIENADAKTFKILKDGYYAKDNKTVFYEEKSINEADPNTFEVLSDIIGKDKNSGFFEEKKIPNSDGQTFQKIESLYSKDKNNVYYSDKKIVGADAKSFEIVDKKTYTTKDKNSFYRYENRLPIKDYATFTQIKGNFWKDKYNVYYFYNMLDDNFVMKGVDPKTAKAVGVWGVKDKYGCHNGYERVKCE